ncbi:MAG: adenosylcobinamide-GDP ribazoletransferase [Actinobacteria bacterium]|nr:adenosylcobinamide-GDP ribazoletransferase [Actinomycetota bacterium]
MDTGRSTFAGARLAVGLLTVLPVGNVVTDRRTVRRALLLAPLVGLTIGTVAWILGGLVRISGGGSLLAAVVSVATPAVATRALHLDGLADLADGLGSGRPAEEALAVMRRSDTGPFGVVTLLLVLLAQVAAVAQAWEVGLAGPALLIGCVTGRLALLWSCRAGVSAARPDGLGALVAGAVQTRAAALATAAVCLAAAAWGASFGSRCTLAFPLAVLAGVGAAGLLLRRAVGRLGGVTGDVLGALVETATTAALIALLLAT